MLVAWQTEHHTVQTLNIQVAPKARLAARVRAAVVRVVPHHVNTPRAAILGAPMHPGAITVRWDVVQDQALPDRVRRTIVGAILHARLWRQHQVFARAEPLPHSRACWVLPARVAEHGSLVFVMKAKAAHSAVLGLVLLAQFPTRGTAAVQMASNDARACVARETPRPAPRLVGWRVREMHCSGTILARSIRRLTAILRLQSRVRSSQWLAPAVRIRHSLLVRVWLRRRQRRERTLSARSEHHRRIAAL